MSKRRRKVANGIQNALSNCGHVSCLACFSCCFAYTDDTQAHRHTGTQAQGHIDTEAQRHREHILTMCTHNTLTHTHKHAAHGASALRGETWRGAGRKREPSPRGERERHTQRWECGEMWGLEGHGGERRELGGNNFLGGSKSR